MTQTANALAGVDGCPGGWIAVIGDGGSLRAEVFGSFSGLVASLSQSAIVAVDMPIGLPEKGGRSAERAARTHLGERQSSVFSIPPRAAVYARDYRESCSLSLERTDPPRKVSRQAFGLFPKICEIDELLRADAGLATRIIESHPELAFTALNGMKAMSLPKKIKSRVNPEGMAERRALLQSCGLPENFLKSPVPRGAKEDDFLDACAMYLVAGRHARGEACPQPDHVEHDAFGLRMAIWA